MVFQQVPLGLKVFRWCVSVAWENILTSKAKPRTVACTCVCVQLWQRCTSTGVLLPSGNISVSLSTGNFDLQADIILWGAYVSYTQIDNLHQAHFVQIGKMPGLIKQSRKNYTTCITSMLVHVNIRFTHSLDSSEIPKGSSYSVAVTTWALALFRP